MTKPAHSGDVGPPNFVEPDLRQHYEREGLLVSRYDSASFWDRYYHQRRFTIVTDLLRPLLQGANSFLDVGCGSGEYLSFAKHLGTSLVCGADISFTYCRRAAAPASGRVVVQASAELLPYSQDSFDVVLCSEVIEHLSSRSSRKALRELCRVARSTVVVTTPNDKALIRRIARLLAPGRVRELDEEVGHINLLARTELREFGASIGGWIASEFETVHVLPPVIGEGLRLPRMSAPIIRRIESVASKIGSNAGNMMALTLRHEST